MSTRVLIADDHPLVRAGIRRVLEQEPDVEVVAEASDGAEAVRRAATTAVDLAILDVAMPRLTGLQAAEQLRRTRPEVKILMLSMYDNEQYLLAALRAGASGYLLKSIVDEEVVAACRAIMRGEFFVHSATATPQLEAALARARAGKPPPPDLLTPRELEVLKLVAEGHSSDRIAALLVISPKTVERHRSNLLHKLGARDRVDLTRYAIRHGLTEA